jgi:hypothetical protein
LLYRYFGVHLTFIHLEHYQFLKSGSLAEVLRNREVSLLKTFIYFCVTHKSLRQCQGGGFFDALQTTHQDKSQKILSLRANHASSDSCCCFLRETQSLEDIPSSSIDFIDALKQRIIVSWPDFNMIPWKPNFQVERRYHKIRERRKRHIL